VVGVGDPDSKVAGRGLEMLRSAGIDVTVGVRSDAINEQLAPYLHHRRTGRPYVVAKVGMSLDGGTAAPDGTSQWITGEPARADAHRLRAESGAIVVGAGTVRADNPSLTVRHVQGPDPLRVVLGQAPEGARVHPCVEWSGSLEGLLDDLGSRGILQVLVEGGATVLRAFRDSDLIDRYVAYVAPSIFGGSDKAPMIAGPSVSTIAGLERGRFAGVRLVGEDLRIDLIPPRRDPA
jgi:diaminohydroxyphosphoribosylaminopyrimidine deaminase/5-amino-6-(5-phosphoribosylamino)uracil reductase